MNSKQNNIVFYLLFLVKVVHFDVEIYIKMIIIIDTLFKRKRQQTNKK